MTPEGGGPARLLRRLAGQRTLARIAIFFEHAWIALWPVFGWAGLFTALALLDAFRLLPPWLHLLALLGFAGGILWHLWRALPHLRWPDRQAGERRLETQSGATHRPLATLTDRPATTDPLAQALWREHLARTVARIGQLRVGRPRPGLAARDRHALRAGLGVVLVASVFVAGPDAPGRLLHAVWPDFTPPPQGPGVQVQGWITPPSYTRLAPIFLKPAGGALSAPAGSKLTLSVTGAPETPSLATGTGTEALHPLDATSFQTERALTQDERLGLSIGRQVLAAWDLTLIPDVPPSVTWPEPAGPQPQGATRHGGPPAPANTRLPWHVTDDYGVRALRAELRLRDRPSAPPLVLPIPLAGEPKDASGAFLANLIAHPWAGLVVTARLFAQDALEQTGFSQEASFILPERHFENRIARQLIGARKHLSLIPEDRRGALELLRGPLSSPEAFAGDPGGWLNLSAIASLLVHRERAEGVDEIQSRLWDLALHIEEGAAERTARALEAARKEAQEALDKLNRTPEDQSKRAELERKLQELRDAIREYMQALREQAIQQNNEVPPDPTGRDQRKMERLTEDAEQAAREGKPKTAEERLAELDRMLNELRQALADPKLREQRDAENRQRGRQQMSVVQDIINREGGILDHAQRRGPPPEIPPYPWRPSRPPADPAQAGAKPDRQADQRVQQALRRVLGELMEQFAELTGRIPPPLNEADLAMREAIQALEAAQDDKTAAAAQHAIEALQRGGRDMARQLARQFGRPQPGEASEGQSGEPGGQGFSLQDGYGNQFGGGYPGRDGRRWRGNGQRDPLGRSLGEGVAGMQDGEVHVPGERERLRTLMLQEELRRRGGQRTRPQQELDYIERLLRQF